MLSVLLLIAGIFFGIFQGQQYANELEGSLIEVGIYIFIAAVLSRLIYWLKPFWNKVIKFIDRFFLLLILFSFCFFAQQVSFL